MNLFQEPVVVINSRRLTEAQAMTLRVSLGIFAMSLADPKSLGDDAMAKSMTSNYLRCIGEINNIIMTERPSGPKPQQVG